MPIRDTHTQVFEYPTAKAGVNLNKNIVELTPEECLLAQNVVWKNGMVKRGGQTLVSSSEVVSSKKILGIHRFYKSDGTKQLLSACDTTVKYLNAGSWTNAITGLASGNKTNMTTWGALNRVYVCNGIDNMRYWTGSVSKELILTDGIPTQALPYQDRLLTIIGGKLTWSKSFSDVIEDIEFTVTIDTPGVFTKIAHGLAINDAIKFSTTAALPTGLTAGTTYYVISAGFTADEFEVSTSVGGSAVDTSGSQSGVHTFEKINANWELASDCGIRPDTILYGMSYHSVANEQAGVDTKILLAGANGMYLFAAKSLIVPFTATGSDYVIYPIATTVGCNAPRTMCWTPKGTMWLGIDKQVYLLPFGSTSPVVVGSKIRSHISGIDGIERIPNAQLENACAVYHNGYYIISVATSSGSYNTVQWWADVNRGYSDENSEFGPWYGPMVGQSIGCFCNQNGTGDGGELIGGEATAKGYVYYLNGSDSYGDINPSTGLAKSIHCAWKTFFNPLGNTPLRKDVHSVEIELLDVLGTVTVNSQDIDGAVGGTSTIGLSGNAIYWDDLYWDEFYWSSSSPTRIKMDFSPALRIRRLALQIEHNTELDKFELYALRASAIDQGQIFE